LRAYFISNTSVATPLQEQLFTQERSFSKKWFVTGPKKVLLLVVSGAVGSYILRLIN
jgi:hypothetical protein